MPAATSSIGHQCPYHSQKRLRFETAGLNQQEEHADGDQQEGAENGAAAHSPHLVADLLPLRSERVTLRAHLGAKLIALVSPLRRGS